MADPARILVRGVNWLGDAVMTTPALMRLRERFPSSRITLLTQEKLRELWLNHPAIDEVLTFHKRDSVWALSRRIKAGRFDMALLLPNSPRSGLEVFLAGVPRRVGGAWSFRNFLLTDVVPAGSSEHRMRKRTPDEVKRLVGENRPADYKSVASGFSQWKPEDHQLYHYLRLVGFLGGSATPLPPLLSLSVEEKRRSAEFVPAARFPMWIGLNAGAEYGPAKRWPIESFAAAANDLYSRLGCGFVIFGGPADTTMAATLAGMLKAPSDAIVSFAGKTTLRELMIALSGCRALLTNDTGPMHVAAALGIPVVVPFGSTSPELTRPGLPGDPTHRLLRQPVPCAPCFLRECPIDLRCLKGIEPRRVADAVVEVVVSKGSVV